MKERPILFSGEMVRAILEGRKTQTRRVVNLPWDDEGEEESIKIEWGDSGHSGPGFYLYCPEYPEEGSFLMNCPYGQPGDHLWVREAWSIIGCGQECCDGKDVVYRTDNTTKSLKWKPSIHMRRWASRLTLEITDIRVERLQDISEEDARAEGVLGTETDDGEDYYYCIEKDKLPVADTAKEVFEMLWDSIYAKRGIGWHANPWVWVISFKRITAE